MPPKEKPMKWLRQLDDEWQWAAEYLDQRLDINHRARSLRPNAFSDLATYESVVSAIREIQKDRLDIVFKLQAAIRQRRYRSDRNGKQSITFTLSTETIKKLRSITKKHDGANVTAVITNLIDVGKQALDDHSNYKKQLNEAISKEHRITYQAVASMEAQKNEAMKYVERYLTLLVQWELLFPDEKPPAVSDEEMAKLIAPRMKELNAAIRYIAYRDSITSERPI